MQQPPALPSAIPAVERATSPLQAAHAKLAEAERCRRAGDLDRAQVLCEALLAEYSDYVGALQTLGAVHLTKRNFRQALSCFIQAAMHCPKDRVNLTNLGTVYLRLGARRLAAQALQEALRLQPNDADVHMTLAEVHREERDYALAAERYQRVLELSPSHADAAHGLADAYLQVGLTEEAAAALNLAHALRPEAVAVLYSATQLPEAAAQIDLLKAMDGVRKQEAQGQAEFESLRDFTRAAALDRLGRHEEAWAALVEANRREYPKHERAHRKHMSRMAAIRDAAVKQPSILAEAEPAAPGQAQSLFIVGPSRAGKSTLESLVGQLAGTKRGFERRLVEPAARRTSQQSGLLTVGDPAGLPRSLDRRFRQIYLEELRDFAEGARIVTDTHPGLIGSVGRVAATIPLARFIFIKRDLDDVALRMFMKPYRAGNHHAYDLATIFEYLSLYNEMSALWMERLPSLTMSVEYEDMIADPRGTLTGVARFCGASMPHGPLPMLGDDRGCAAPYRELIAAAAAEAWRGRS
jgi:tetratricopeptide (TPR) repeat protein